jgi:hypothetical protein
MTPLSPRFERDSDVGYDGDLGGGAGFLAPVTGDGTAILLPDGVTALALPSYGHPSEAWASVISDDEFAGNDFLTPDTSAEMLADRVYLLDQTVATPMNAGVSFAGVDRVGIPVKTAEILIDLQMTDPTASFYEDDNFVGESFATVEDISHVDRALRAVNAAKTPSQMVLTSFEAFKPVTFGSVIQETTKAGEWLPALL